MIRTDFTPSSVAHGLRFDEFAKLSKSIKLRLVRLMARISEASYRRGYQHGAHFGNEALALKLRDWDLDQAPWIAGEKRLRKRDRAVDRLIRQHEELAEIGFRDEVAAARDRP